MNESDNAIAFFPRFDRYTNDNLASFSRTRADAKRFSVIPDFRDRRGAHFGEILSLPPLFLISSTLVPHDTTLIHQHHVARRLSDRLTGAFRGFSPDIVQLRVGAYPERLRVRAHGVQFPMGVEFGAADRLHVLQRGDGNEPWPAGAAVAASVAGVELRPRLLLQRDPSLDS